MTDDTTPTRESTDDSGRVTQDHDYNYDREATGDGGDGGGDREGGIDFGAVDDELDTASYPMTLDELLAAHGDAELGVGDETTALGEVLGPLEEDEYDSADEVRQAVFSMVDAEAVGRRGYTDRGGSSGGGEEDGHTTNESL